VWDKAVTESGCGGKAVTEKGVWGKAVIEEVLAVKLS
jgi:hypothetical protein